MLPRLWPAVLSLGWIVLAMAVAELVMAAVALAADDGEAPAFAIGAAISALAGGGAVLATKGRPFQLNFRDAVILTVAAWLVLPVFAALPFLLEPVALSPVDAFFEMVSAITTTGSTVMTGLDSRPTSLLLWRSTVQWLGGFGIIGLAIVILPFLKIGGMQLLRLEFSDRSDKALPRVKMVAQTIGQIYLGLTVLCFVVYLALGMTPFDALNHAFTTVCTGGLSTHDASFGHFDGAALRWAGIVFMIASSIPFLAYLRLVGRGRAGGRRDPQVIAFLVLIAVVAGGVALYLRLNDTYDTGSAITEATFNVVSVITTTGYASTDYTLWGGFPVFVFLLITFIGGCTGSTSGGIKVMRFQVIASALLQQLRRTIYPHRVQPVRFDGRTVADEQVASVLVFVCLYLGLVLAGSLLLSLTGLDTMTAVSGAAQAVGNVGLGLGPIIGPAGNYSSLADGQKLILAASMVLGRLEILSVLVLFAPSFYR